MSVALGDVLAGERIAGITVWCIRYGSKQYRAYAQIGVPSRLLMIEGLRYA